MKKYLIKTVITGDHSTGKSSIIIRYTDKTFTMDAHPTIGVDFRLKNVSIDDVDFKLQLWDTAGQEQFRGITESYFRNVYLFFIVFDITNRNSFNHIHRWIELIKKNISNPYKFVLIGNCIDLEHKRMVSYDEAICVANYYKMEYYEVSAKNNINIDNMFNNILKNILVNIDKITLGHGIIDSSIPQNISESNNSTIVLANRFESLKNVSVNKNCCS